MSTLGTVPAGKIWLGDFKKSESHLGNCASWLRNILIDLEKLWRNEWKSRLSSI